MFWVIGIHSKAVSAVFWNGGVHSKAMYELGEQSIVHKIIDNCIVKKMKN